MAAFRSLVWTLSKFPRSFSSSSHRAINSSILATIRRCSASGGSGIICFFTIAVGSSICLVELADLSLAGTSLGSCAPNFPYIASDKINSRNFFTPSGAAKATSKYFSKSSPVFIKIHQNLSKQNSINN